MGNAPPGEQASPSNRVLEIGCGTGQLSVPLAQHGVDLLAIELGPHLATLAKQNLKQFPNVQVETSSFEAYPLPPQKFDAVVSASAFHWLNPDVRFSKSAEALHPGGFLMILHVHHVRGGTPGFFADTRPYYVKWGLSDESRRGFLQDISRLIEAKYNGEIVRDFVYEIIVAQRAS